LPFTFSLYLSVFDEMCRDAIESDVYFAGRQNDPNRRRSIFL
jgi:hypothetical protein